MINHSKVVENSMKQRYITLVSSYRRLNTNLQSHLQKIETSETQSIRQILARPKILKIEDHCVKNDPYRSPSKLEDIIKHLSQRLKIFIMLSRKV